MLEEYKQLYINSANLIPDWQDLSTLEISNKYFELKKQNNALANSCVSSIICRYWYLISYYYNKQQYKFASPEDCYEWLIDAVIYTLENHVWTNPESSVYNDPKAPDKSIIVCMSSISSNFYVASKRQKRVLNNKKINFNQLNKFEDETDEECLDRVTKLNYYYLDNTDIWFRDFIHKKVQILFNDKEYFNAFALDAIINSNVFKELKKDSVISVILDKKRFQHHLRYIKDAFCKWFAKEYSLDLDVVQDSVKYVNNLTNDKFNRNFRQLCSLILSDKDFRVFLNLDE